MDIMKILCRTADDWSELYVDGKLLYEGHDQDNDFFRAFIQYLMGKGVVSDYRKIEVAIDPENPDDAPLHCFTGKLYCWEDWDKASSFWSL